MSLLRFNSNVEILVNSVVAMTMLITVILPVQQMVGHILLLKTQLLLLMARSQFLISTAMLLAVCGVDANSYVAISNAKYDVVDAADSEITNNNAMLPPDMPLQLYSVLSQFYKCFQYTTTLTIIMVPL